MTMDYAIATHSFLVVVRFNDEYDVIGHWVISDGGHHYGLAIDSDLPATLLSKQKSTKLLRFSTQDPYEYIETVPVAGRMRFVHQIAAANGGLYFTNAHYNSIVYQTIGASVHHEYFFNNKDFDYNHVNSVYPCGGQIFALLNNFRRRPSEVALLEHDTAHGFSPQRVMSLWHAGCHNLMVDDSRLYYNASADRRFVAVDLESQKVARELEFPGHTKGLSLRDDRMLVGFSDVAAREERRRSRGYLAVVDTRTLSVLRTVDLNFPSLPHPIGNVNEIRCISGGERGHTRAQPHARDWSRMELARDGTLSWATVLGRQQTRRLAEHARRIAGGHRSNRRGNTDTGATSDSPDEAPVR
jgi:hypothetical protein